MLHLFFFFFFFNDTATTEIYTLSLHDALPISFERAGRYRLEFHDAGLRGHASFVYRLLAGRAEPRFEVYTLTNQVSDRKSTRLNSSHLVISYAVFCLKKKKKKNLCFVMIEIRY